MKMQRRVASVVVLLVCVAAVAGAQGSTVPSSRATAFMGTWTFAMTNPPNSEQTIHIWDKNGVVGASLQVGKFGPPTDITGVFKDSDVLVLTTTLRENGAPIWAVVALTLDGQTMNMAQMLQQSQTIKRGSGKRQG